MTSDSNSVQTGKTPCAARLRFGAKALATGAGGGGRPAVAGCRWVPPVRVDIEIRARWVPPEIVDNCCRVTSIKPPRQPPERTPGTHPPSTPGTPPPQSAADHPCLIPPDKTEQQAVTDQPLALAPKQRQRHVDARSPRAPTAEHTSSPPPARPTPRPSARTTSRRRRVDHPCYRPRGPLPALSGPVPARAIPRVVRH